LPSSRTIYIPHHQISQETNITQKKFADLFSMWPEQSASALHLQPHFFSNFPTAAFRSITQHTAPATGFSRFPPEPTAGRNAGAHTRDWTDELEGDVFIDEERYFSFFFPLSYFWVGAALVLDKLGQDINMHYLSLGSILFPACKKLSLTLG
jgi:hypothetical protein